MNYTSKHSIKNSSQLIEKIRDIKINRHTKLISFDIKNLYQNIPVQEAIQICRDFIISSETDLHSSDIENITHLLNQIAEQNFFSFNNKIYKMTDGLPMGSPLSGILSEFYVDRMEEIFFSEQFHLFNRDVRFYCRYVDDIFIIHDQHTVFNTILKNILNNLGPLKFTLETESNDSLSYLDLKISKDYQQSSLFFDIYRKETTTDTIIPKSSYAPRQHKEAAFRYLFHRALSIPLTKDNFDRELSTIISIGSGNGYLLKDLQYIYDKVRKSIINHHIYPHHTAKKFFITLNINEISPQIVSTLHKHDINIAIKSSKKLINHLSNVKSICPENQKSGVYRFDCDSCECFYLGQTGRSLEIRYNEHIKSDKSAMYNHLKTERHQTNLNKMSLLHQVKKSKRLDLLEEMEILKHKQSDQDNLLNYIIPPNFGRMYARFMNV